MENYENSKMKKKPQSSEDYHDKLAEKDLRYKKPSYSFEKNLSDPLKLLQMFSNLAQMDKSISRDRPDKDPRFKDPRFYKKYHHGFDDDDDTDRYFKPKKPKKEDIIIEPIPDPIPVENITINNSNGEKFTDTISLLDKLISYLEIKKESNSDIVLTDNEISQLKSIVIQNDTLCENITAQSNLIKTLKDSNDKITESMAIQFIFFIFTIKIHNSNQIREFIKDHFINIYNSYIYFINIK